MPRAWEGDWTARIYQRVRAVGFPTVTAFADSRPRDSLVALAETLGPDVAAVQLETLLGAEAAKRGTTATFARALLLRRIRERIPDGWGVADRYDFETEIASAFARWAVGLNDKLEPAADRVWENFKRIDVPKGWLPDEADDPILVQAFSGIAFDE